MKRWLILINVLGGAAVLGIYARASPLMLMLTDRDRKTGLARVTALQYEEIDDAIVVGSSRGTRAEQIGTGTSSRIPMCLSGSGQGNSKPLLSRALILSGLLTSWSTD